MIKAKSQFKTRSVANNVEIIIPVPRDVDSPSFKVLYIYTDEIFSRRILTYYT